MTRTGGIHESVSPILSRFPGPHSRRFAGLFAAIGVLLVPAVASASKDEVVQVDTSLDGTHVYNHFTVKAGATLSVTSKASGSGAGRLEIRANVITIEHGATIDASGAGFVGVDAADGNAGPGTNGGGGKGPLAGFPGGGGGFFIAGDPGTTEGTPGTCVPLATPNGGAAFFAALKMAELGSAGGAANVMPTLATKGGAGGGVILLAAASVTIDGTVQANGASPPMAPGGVGPGGGSGGTIQITAASLAGMGTLSAVGGNGVHGPGSANPAMPIAANNGGGGGSGVIILQLPAGAPTGSLLFNIQNGKTGDCPGTPMMAMPVVQPLSTGCVDIDGDGVPSIQCGGMDCDDADQTIHPGAAEVCDGQDNDCNQKVDDGANLCPAGTACTNGACVAVVPADAGPGSDGGEGGGPPATTTAGCAAAPHAPARGLSLLLGLGLPLLLARRAGKRHLLTGQNRSRKR